MGIGGVGVGVVVGWWGWGAFAETERLSQKSKHVVQKTKNGHKIPIIVTTIVTKENSSKELVIGTHNDTCHQSSAHPKTQSYRL